MTDSPALETPVTPEYTITHSQDSINSEEQDRLESELHQTLYKMDEAIRKLDDIDWYCGDYINLSHDRRIMTWIDIDSVWEESERIKLYNGRHATTVLWTIHEIRKRVHKIKLAYRRPHMGEGVFEDDY